MAMAVMSFRGLFNPGKRQKVSLVDTYGKVVRHARNIIANHPVGTVRADAPEIFHREKFGVFLEVTEKVLDNMTRFVFFALSLRTNIYILEHETSQFISNFLDGRAHFYFISLTAVTVYQVQHHCIDPVPVLFAEDFTAFSGNLILSEYSSPDRIVYIMVDISNPIGYFDDLSLQG